MSEEHKQETFGLRWHISEIKHDIVYFVQSATMAFNHAVNEFIAGTEFDKKLTKARLSLAVSKKQRKRIKKGYGLRYLFKRQTEYFATNSKIIQLGRQRMSKATTEAEKQDLVRLYGQRGADSWVKISNISALMDSKKYAQIDYVEERRRNQSNNSEHIIPVYYLKGEAFRP